MTKKGKVKSSAQKRKISVKKKSRPEKKKTSSGKKNPTQLKRIKMRIIGIGGGGSSVVADIAHNIKGASFYAANSDVRALKRLPRKVFKFQFGKELTHGLGTGMDPEIGEEAAKKEKERIKKILQGQDFVIIVACLGGGLGSGAAPVFAKISKDLGNLTYGIFTLPFNFEGEKKMEIARDSLRKIKRSIHAFSVIPNERIFKIIDRTDPLKDALSAINKKLSDSIQSLIEIIYKPGLINIDFADLRTIFSRKGKLTYLNSVNLEKDSKDDMVETVIDNSLYPYGISGAKGVLFNISGRSDLSLTQVNQISKLIAEKAHRDAKIIFGISPAKKGSGVGVMLLATGCRGKGFSKKPKKAGAKKNQTSEPKTKARKPKKKTKPTSRKKVVSKQPAVQEKQTTKSNKKEKKNKAKKARLLKKKPAKRKIEVKTIPPDDSQEEGKIESSVKDKQKQRVRRNALQLKKEKEKEEAEIISKEKFWETPTFLRKKTI